MGGGEGELRREREGEGGREEGRVGDTLFYFIRFFSFFGEQQEVRSRFTVGGEKGREKEEGDVLYN